MDKRFYLLIAALVLFESFFMFLYPRTVTDEVRYLLLLLSFSYFYYVYSHFPNEGYTYIPLIGSKKNLDSNIFPLVGLILISLDVGVNYIFYNFVFGSKDQIIFIAAFGWCVHPFIPKNLYWERDFTFLFLNYFMVLVIGIHVISLIFFEFFDYENRFLTEFFLTKPLQKLLLFLGIDSFGQGEMLSFRLHNGESMTVSIAKRCSGFYSICIFLSAFFSLITLDFRKIDSMVILLGIIGLFLAYLANLFRMAVIVLVGHYQGSDSMKFVHSNLGWLIFLLWLSIFWTFYFQCYKITHTWESKNI